MELIDFVDVIRALPVGRHTVRVRAANWIGRMPEDAYQTVFGEETELSISRGQLLRMPIADQLRIRFYEILMWGYPSGLRGLNLATITANENSILQELGDVAFVPGGIPDWETFWRDADLPGVGLSTLTKLLYFFQTRIAGLNPVILDERIIAVLKDRRFQELGALASITTARAPQMYQEYLGILDNISTANNLDVAQIEWFLFAFGNSLS